MTRSVVRVQKRSVLARELPRRNLKCPHDDVVLFPPLLAVLAVQRSTQDFACKLFDVVACASYQLSMRIDILKGRRHTLLPVGPQ